MRGMMTGVANKFKPGTSPILPRLHITGDDGFIDISGFSHTVTAVGATQTGNIHNGHAALNTDGIDDYIAINSVATYMNGIEVDLYMVISHANSASYEPAVSWNKFSINNAYSSLDTRDSDESNGTYMRVVSSSDAVQDLADTSDVGSILHVVNIRMNVNDVEFKINNDTPITSTLSSRRSDNDRFTLGALVRATTPSGFVFGDYDFCEIKLFNSLHTDEQRAIEISDLAAKYAISL